jgi:hypothetical protein
MALSRSVGAAQAAGQTRGAEDEAFSLRFATLHEFLTQLVWEDGKPRKPGSILLFTDQARWKLLVHDKDARMGAFLTGNTVDGLLQDADDGLSNGSLDWRKDTR